MAERGAHLTTAAVEDRPSIFQVLAQESLMEAVRPALRHAVKVLAESHPSHLGFLWRSFDEIYLLLDLLLQNHFLRVSSASFSENFYGLKRVPAGHGRPSHWRSLLLLCLLPYLRSLLEERLSRQREEDDFSIRVSRSRGQRVSRALVALYPYLSSSWEVLLFSQQLLYVFGRVRSHSPLLWLAGVKLALLTSQDLRSMELEHSRPADPAEMSVLSRCYRAASLVAGGVAVSLSTSLSLGVFFLQFLEWWFSSGNQDSLKSLTSLPAPPPPLHLLQPSSSSSSSSRRCPLCRRPCTNHTVLSTSGFLFCYTCIYLEVKRHQRCPMTGYPSQLQHLVKIYSSEG